MQISPKFPLFKGVAHAGQEPAVVKEGLEESTSFNLYGKKYTVWDTDIVTLENGYSEYNRATLIHPINAPNGTGLETTRNKKILGPAEDKLRKVFQSLAQKAD